MKIRKPPLYAILAVFLALGMYRAVQADLEAYSTTAASNNQTPPNGFPENQAASTVNDSARELMAQIARFVRQGVLSTFGPDGGTSNAYYITPALRPLSLISGQRITFVPGSSNTAAAPTIKIGSLGPLTIAKISNQALVSGDIAANVPADLFYNGGLGGMVLLNPRSNLLSAGQSTAPSGSIVDSGYTMNTARVLGRTTASTGAIEELDADDGSLALGTGTLRVSVASSTQMKAVTSITQAVIPQLLKYAPHVAKACGNINTNGGAPTLVSSFGVTSIADTTTGTITVTLNSTFSAANRMYPQVTEDFTGAVQQGRTGIANRTTTTFQIVTYDASNNLADLTGTAAGNLSFCVFGDLS